MNKTYLVYGLFIQSYIPLHGFRENLESDHVDVVVKNDEIPECKFDDRGLHFDIRPNYFKMGIEGVGIYTVVNGNVITVHPLTSDEDAVRIYLLGSCLAALFMQRNLLALHASSIKIENSAILFAGRSGSGKSTTVASLVARGYEIVSDDISVISFHDNESFVHAGPSYVKVHQDIYEQFGLDNYETKKYLNYAEKWQIEVSKIEETKVPIKAIYYLEFDNTLSNPAIIDPENLLKLDIIDSQIYQEYYRDTLAESKEYHKNIFKLASIVPIKVLKRSLNIEDLDCFENLLLADDG